MKIELSPLALDTLNLALQGLAVAANTTRAELMAEATRVQQEEQEAQRKAALEAQGKLGTPPPGPPPPDDPTRSPSPAAQARPTGRVRRPK